LKRRIFQSKRILLLVLAACAFETVLSGRSIGRPAPSAHNWINIVGLLFSGWIVTALALRTSISKERFLFGIISAIFILWIAIALMLPSQEIVHILRWMILLLWVGATASGIAIFLKNNVQAQ
jgi:hypothetical protein